MKLSELSNPTENVNGVFKVINDRMPIHEHEFPDKSKRMVKTLVIVDIDALDSKNSALLDLYDNDIELFKESFKKNIKVVNGYARKRTNKKGEQFYISYSFKDGKQVGTYEKV